MSMGVRKVRSLEPALEFDISDKKEVLSTDSSCEDKHRIRGDKCWGLGILSALSCHGNESDDILWTHTFVVAVHEWEELLVRIATAVLVDFASVGSGSVEDESVLSIQDL